MDALTGGLERNKIGSLIDRNCSRVGFNIAITSKKYEIGKESQDDQADDSRPGIVPEQKAQMDQQGKK
uniref:Uncharacterized protein n=1 Tax=viral metagenome TaxID=1070528 RepID=A0A6M3LS35_9ZZZZ